MRKLIHSKLGKSIMILCAFIIFISLIVSGTCYGFIDQLFIGWRDTTGCFPSGDHGDIPINNSWLSDPGFLFLASIISVILFSLLYAIVLFIKKHLVKKRKIK